MALRGVAQGDVDRAEARKAKLRERESELHTRLVAIPATEAALQPLARDLDEAGKVLAIRQQDASAARAAVQFYRSGDVSDVTRYRVDAWAAVPVHPSGPARWRYLATALVLGSIIGYGLLLLQRKLEGDPLESVDDLAEIYPTAVVVEVPDLAANRRRLPRIRVGDVLMTGYVTACLARLTAQVTSIDADADIIEFANANISQCGLGHVDFKAMSLAQLDAPESYDAIAVTASLPQVPENLKQALKTGGRMFVIVGDSPVMEALLVTRVTTTEWTTQSLFETDLPRLRQ